MTLLTDPNMQVAALDLSTQATGIVSHGEGRSTLILDRVSKSQTINPRDLIVTQGFRVGTLTSHYPRGIPIGVVSGASQNDVDLYWQVQLSPRVDFGSLQSVLVLVPKSRQTLMRQLLEIAKVALLVFVAAILQVTLFSSIQILEGTPDVVLLTLMSIAFLRGSIYGAAAGFVAGLLVDTANLATLGVTSLLLTIAGYWIGRYGETTGRDRVHAPFVSVAVATIARPVRRAAPPLHARRSRLGACGAARRAAAEDRAQPPADAARLRAHALGALARARAREGDGGAAPWLAEAPAPARLAAAASCRPTRGSRSPTASRPSSRCGSGSWPRSRWSCSGSSSSGSGRCRCSRGRGT